NQDYGPWLATVDERTPHLMTLQRSAFEVGVSELLKELGSSHTAFFHQRRDRIPAPYSINATLRAVDSTEGKRWMFVDVIEEGFGPGHWVCPSGHVPWSRRPGFRQRLGQRHSRLQKSWRPTPYRGHPREHRRRPRLSAPHELSLSGQARNWP